VCCTGKSDYSSRNVWLGSIHGVSCDSCTATSCNVYTVRIHALRSGLVHFARLSVFILYSVDVYKCTAFTRDHTYKALYHMLYVATAISIMTWLLAGRSKIRILADGKILLPSPESSDWLWNAKKVYYWTGNGNAFLGWKTGGTWSWPLTSISLRDSEWVQLQLNCPHTGVHRDLTSTFLPQTQEHTDRCLQNKRTQRLALYGYWVHRNYRNHAFEWVD
jgi:hypothetical protein